MRVIAAGLLAACWLFNEDVLKPWWAERREAVVSFLWLYVGLAGFGLFYGAIVVLAIMTS